MDKTKKYGTAGMAKPKKSKGPKGSTLSNGGDMSKHMDCVKINPTTNGKGKSGY